MANRLNHKKKILSLHKNYKWKTWLLLLPVKKKYQKYFYVEVGT